ncbi:MAG: hypothetical protein IT281_03390 [Ignavibacteria bacterium]|nr:hypothetical protein [Ignavibacteria bacterium]MCC7158563.1 hypothetical protein [Ignavibacteria bacterium]
MTKIKLLYFLLIIALPFLLSSCTTVYVPNEINTPLFTDKNEFRGGLSYGVSGLNLHLAYSITNHFGLMTNGSYINLSKSSSSIYQRYGEFGIGYFRKFDAGKQATADFELFGGLGFGETRSHDNNTIDQKEEGTYYKTFLQPTMAFALGWIHLALSFRFNYLSFYSHTTTNSSVLKDNPKAIGVEPAISLLMGTYPLKMKYQIGVSMIGPTNSVIFGRDFFFTSIGLVIGL